jgi:hypothetical protein
VSTGGHPGGVGSDGNGPCGRVPHPRFQRLLLRGFHLALLRQEPYHISFATPARSGLGGDIDLVFITGQLLLPDRDAVPFVRHPDSFGHQSVGR